MNRGDDDNIFLDLGFSEEEAETLSMRSDLMNAIRSTIERRGLSQAEAAKLCKVKQPRISNLMTGRIDLFSIDALVKMAARVGIKVSLVISAPAPATGRAAYSHRERTTEERLPSPGMSGGAYAAGDNRFSGRVSEETPGSTWTRKGRGAGTKASRSGPPGDDPGDDDRGSLTVRSGQTHEEAGAERDRNRAK